MHYLRKLSLVCPENIVIARIIAIARIVIAKLDCTWASIKQRGSEMSALNFLAKVWFF